MRKVIVILSCVLVGLTVAAPASAASRHAGQQVVNWAQRDTAVYVVSTLNLLRTDSGQPLTDVFKTQLHVKRYTVEADTEISDLYFIKLVDKSNSVAAVFAYKMGWQKPQAVTDFSLGNVAHASSEIVTAYRTDHRARVATFKSTLPS